MRVNQSKQNVGKWHKKIQNIVEGQVEINDDYTDVCISKHDFRDGAGTIAIICDGEHTFAMCECMPDVYEQIEIGVYPQDVECVCFMIPGLTFVYSLTIDPQTDQFVLTQL